MEKNYHLYLTTCHKQESHSLNVVSSPDLNRIKKALVFMIKAMFEDSGWHWYYEGYAEEQAEEMVKPFVGLLKDGSEITKRGYSFFHLGFIITNYPMWPDNQGGYLNHFIIPG